MKKNVCVFYGGRSVEHDISIITAIQAINNIDAIKYNIYPLYIKNQRIYLMDNYCDIHAYTDFNPKLYRQVIIFNSRIFIIKKNKLKEFIKPHSALICCHGGLGEGGGLQGMLEYNDIPYTSSDILGSSIGLDKLAQKMIFNDLGIKTIPYIVIDNIKSLNKENISNIYVQLGDKLIIKPSTLGSSIGISVAYDSKQLVKGVELALMYDDKALIEPLVDIMGEYNCAIYKKEDNFCISNVEKVLRHNDYLTFEDKYIEGDKSGMSGMKREIFHTDNEITKNIKSITDMVYKALSLKGIVRIDYIVDMDNNIYLNEINTIPGSLSFYLFNQPYMEVLTDIIEQSIKDKELKYNKITSFNTSFLTKNFKINK